MENIFNFRNMAVILEYISDGVQVIDKDGRLIFCNKKSAMLDDINIESSMGKHITDIYPSLTEETSTLINVIKTGHPILNHEQSYTTYKGNMVNTINTTLPIKQNGVMVGAIEISKNITEVKELSEKVVALQSKVYGDKAKISDESAHFEFDDIVTNNQEMMRLKATAMKVAQSDIPILVYGETGTGKELIVQSIHNSSSRRKKPFIAQNCAAIPPTLLEGILFGSVKGSYTGATDRAGLLEVADGGTLFLDEINSMPIELQGKFLRVLQDGKVRRVGDTKNRLIDIRIIAAINIDPQEALEKGLIRKDLYFRMNTVTLVIPRLADRKDDILPLVRFFIKKFNDKMYLNIKGISPKVEDMFMRYEWPGNVRELEHIIEGAMSLVDGEIIEEDVIPLHISRNLAEREGRGFIEVGRGIHDLKTSMEQAEMRIIAEALETSGGNTKKAAEILKIPRQTLQYKMKKYEL